MNSSDVESNEGSLSTNNPSDSDVQRKSIMNFIQFLFFFSFKKCHSISVSPSPMSNNATSDEAISEARPSNDTNFTSKHHMNFMHLIVLTTNDFCMTFIQV